MGSYHGAVRSRVSFLGGELETGSSCSEDEDNSSPETMATPAVVAVAPSVSPSSLPPPLSRSATKKRNRKNKKRAKLVEKKNAVGGGRGDAATGGAGQSGNKKDRNGGGGGGGGGGRNSNISINNHNNGEGVNRGGETGRGKTSPARVAAVVEAPAAEIIKKTETIVTNGNKEKQNHATTTTVVSVEITKSIETVVTNGNDVMLTDHATTMTTAGSVAVTSASAAAVVAAPSVKERAEDATPSGSTAATGGDYTASTFAGSTADERSLGTPEDMALLVSVGLGPTQHTGEAWDPCSDSSAQALLMVCRRGYGAKVVKKVMDEMRQLNEPYDDPDTVELQLQNADWEIAGKKSSTTTGKHSPSGVVAQQKNQTSPSCPRADKKASTTTKSASDSPKKKASPSRPSTGKISNTAASKSSSSTTTSPVQKNNRDASPLRVANDKARKNMNATTKSASSDFQQQKEALSPSRPAGANGKHSHSAGKKAETPLPTLPSSSSVGSSTAVDLGTERGETDGNRAVVRVVEAGVDSPRGGGEDGGVDIPDTVEGALKVVAADPTSIPAVLQGMRKWVDMRLLPPPAPSPSSRDRGEQDSAPSEAFSAEAGTGRSVSPLFDSDALPTAIGRVMLQAVGKEGGGNGGDFEASKKELTELLSGAMPTLGDARGGDNPSASAAVKHCMEVIGSARRLCSSGDGYILSPNAIRLISERLTSELRIHRRDFLLLKKATTAVVDISASPAGSQEERGFRGAGKRGVSGDDLFAERESRQHAAAALGQVCLVTSSARQTGEASFCGDSQDGSNIDQPSQDPDLLVRALWTGYPQQRDGGGSLDVAEASRKKVQAEACRARLGGLDDAERAEVVSLEAAAAASRSRLDKLGETRRRLMAQLEEVDAAIETEKIVCSRVQKEVVSTHARYQKHRATEAQQLVECEKALRHIGEIEKLPSVISSLRRELGEQLSHAASNAFPAGDGRETPLAGCGGGDADGTLRAYVESLEAYLETESECIRRLYERASVQEASMKRSVSDMSQYEALAMPMAAAEARAAAVEAYNKAKEDTTAARHMLCQVSHQAQTLTRALSSRTSSGTSTSTTDVTRGHIVGSGTVGLDYPRPSSVSTTKCGGISADRGGGGVAFNRVRELFAALGIAENGTITTTYSAPNGGVGGGVGAGGAGVFVGGGEAEAGLKVGRVETTAVAVGAAGSTVAVANGKGQGQAAVHMGGRTNESPPSSSQQSVWQQRPPSSVAFDRSSFVATPPATAPLMTPHQAASGGGTTANGDGVRKLAPSRIRGGIRLPSPSRDGGRSLGGHLNWLNTATTTTTTTNNNNNETTTTTIAAAKTTAPPAPSLRKSGPKGLPARSRTSPGRGRGGSWGIAGGRGRGDGRGHPNRADNSNRGGNPNRGVNNGRRREGGGGAAKSEGKAGARSTENGSGGESGGVACLPPRVRHKRSPAAATTHAVTSGKSSVSRDFSVPATADPGNGMKATAAGAETSEDKAVFRKGQEKSGAGAARLTTSSTVGGSVSVARKTVDDGKTVMAAVIPVGEAGAGADNERLRRVIVERESESDAPVDDKGRVVRGGDEAAAATVSSPSPVLANNSAGAAKSGGGIRNDPRNDPKNDERKGSGTQEDHGGRRGKWKGRGKGRGKVGEARTPPIASPGAGL